MASELEYGVPEVDEEFSLDNVLRFRAVCFRCAITPQQQSDHRARSFQLTLGELLERRKRVESSITMFSFDEKHALLISVATCTVMTPF